MSTFRIVMRPVRKVSSNCLSNGLSLHCEVLSRYSSFGIARLFLRIAKASWACRCLRRSTALVRSSILSWMALSCPYVLSLLLLLSINYNQINVIKRWHRQTDRRTDVRTDTRSMLYAFRHGRGRRNNFVCLHARRRESCFAATQRTELAS